MEKEDIFWIVGIVLILVGIGLLSWGAYYIWAGSVVGTYETAATEATGGAYQGTYGAGLIAGGVVLLIIGIVLICVGLFLLYKYKLKELLEK